MACISSHSIMLLHQCMEDIRLLLVDSCFILIINSHTNTSSNPAITKTAARQPVTMQRFLMRHCLGRVHVCFDLKG